MLNFVNIIMEEIEMEENVGHVDRQNKITLNIDKYTKCFFFSFFFMFCIYCMYLFLKFALNNSLFSK